MARAPTKPSVEIEVLTESRRRCAICYGLSRDDQPQIQGQIAHIDRDSSNSQKSNLVWLCLPHHDAYDSRPSQSKGFKPEEIRAYQRELLDHMGEALKQRVSFGYVTLPKEDPYAGTYVRDFSPVDYAELTLTPLSESGDGYPRYAVTGTALWGTNREAGPNMGDLAIIESVVDDALFYSADSYNDNSRIVRIDFTKTGLTLVEEFGDSYSPYGHNVNFNGVYRRLV